MKFYAIVHKPSGRYFPLMNKGSTYFDFSSPAMRTKHAKDNVPPRLFESVRMARRYITEYCKGIRSPESFGNAVTYTDPLTPRSIYDFQVVGIELTAKEIIND